MSRSCLALLAVATATVALTAPLAAVQASPDLEALGRIRDEGFRRSQVMEVARHLTDEIGPRLTGSAGMREANDWTKEKLTEWGLANARLETYDFGEGWSYSRASVRQTKPRFAPIAAAPRAWSVGTTGPVTGIAMKADLETKEDFEALVGKVRGKILFVSDAPEHDDPAEPAFHRYDAEMLEELAECDLPTIRDREEFRERRKKQRELWIEIADKLVEEGVVAVVDVSSFEFGAVRTGGIYSSRVPNLPAGPPQITFAMEPYERILRQLDDGAAGDIEIEIDVEVAFDRGSTLAANTLAEIPGSAKSGEIVMAGAHLDSWHPGTGATDNAAGSAIVMEAMRILKAIDAKPRKTIRAALWSGEEQGLLGSRAYVEQHFATRPEPTDEAELKLAKRWRKTTWPISVRPEHKSLAVYFNLDNGGGKVRGVYAQENLAAKAKLERWIDPLADLGVTTVTMNNTGSTDHSSFDGVGLPGFQLIQDQRDYSSRTHHSNLDTYDRLDADDLKQAAVALASLLYQAAMDPEPFPRKPMPTEPKPAKKKEAKAEEAKPEEVKSTEEKPAAEQAPPPPAPVQ